MIKIIIADDHKIVREGICRLLEDKVGFTVVGQAADGHEATELVAKLSPDVLVTDLRMPRVNGIEVTRRIKKSFPRMKIIILSMYSAEAYVYSALAAGASAYVLKDSGIFDLDIAILKALKGQRYLSPPLTEKAIEKYWIDNDKLPLF